jgi:beta-1,4-mannosyltransferase
MYDRPPHVFAKPSLETSNELWQRLGRDLSLGPRRIPLVVAPTSWTPDEDFDLLLESLERAERALIARLGKPDGTGPDLAVLLTGRGEMRATFEKRLARRDFKRVAVRTVWLEPADYPTLIGMADAGLCLHQSSSGLDLPMKLADFRGAGVPVCAFDYGPVLSEALTPGHEGITFHEPGQLAVVLIALATADLAAAPAFAASRAWVAANPSDRWLDEWNRAAKTVLNPGG